MRYINELKSGDMISDIYLCKTKQTLKTKAGKSYYSMMLQDKTGTVDAKVWELTPGIEYFEPMDFIKVEGQVTSFQGSLQLNLRRIRRAKEGEYIPADAPREVFRFHNTSALAEIQSGNYCKGAAETRRSREFFRRKLCRDYRNIGIFGAFEGD